MRRALALIAVAAASLIAAPAPAQPNDPSLAGFPPGYIQDCATRGAGAVTVVPAPMNAYMRIVCTKVSDVLAPLPGAAWQFTNGTTGFLTALNPHNASAPSPAHFSRLTFAPLSAADLAGFRQRLRAVITNPAILAADVMRLEVDTSTGDHKQEYFLVGHGAGGAITGEWGIECYTDCNPMEQQPWAFTVVRSGGQHPSPSAAEAAREGEGY